MVQIKKSETIVNGRAFNIPDFMVKDIVSSVVNEDDLISSLAEIEQIWEDDRIEYELETLGKLGYNVNILSLAQIEQIVWDN